MAGRDGIDPNGLPMAVHDPGRVTWRGRRVVLLSDPVIARASRASAGHVAAVERAGEVLAASGAEVEHAPRRLLEQAGDAWFAALQSVGGPAFSELLADGGPFRLEVEVLRTLVGAGRYSWPALFFSIGERFGRRSEARLRQALKETRRFVRSFEDLVGVEGVLVTPTHPRIAPRHRGAVLRPLDFLYTAAFNVLRVPVTSAPAGLESGMPVGVQLAAARGCDHLTIAAASALESALGAWCPAPAASPAAVVGGSLDT
jgi:fatty acid amide hydrolase 2